MVFVFLFSFTSLIMISSSCIHVAANDIVSFIFMTGVVVSCIYGPHLSLEHLGCFLVLAIINIGNGFYGIFYFLSLFFLLALQHDWQDLGSPTRD